MAGKSHNHTMNIGIKVDASGIGKTNSELKNISNEVNGLNGKKIDLQLNLSDKASKTIDSITKSIGSMEKGLNSISTKGIQGIQDAVSGATKSIDSLTSAIGSVQKSLDTISAKGVEDISSAMGDVGKSSQDAASGVGSVATAVQEVNIGNIEELASALGQVQTQAQDAASSVAKAMETSGFTDNWNNSYGGRYGGMRYTGQGKGISDLVSFLSGGKNSYELTVENAMNKTRNMAVAKSWHSEDGISGMDAYWALDSATNNSLMSLNTLAAGINATAATTGASAKDIEKHAQDFADFGTMVLGLGYDEKVAQTAVMKLGRGLHGTFAALDQYGITKESLTATGLWNGDENDLDGYMAAVSEYSRAMSDQLLKTPTGQMATVGKSMSLGGYAWGAIEAQATADIVSRYKQIDDDLRSWTKSLNRPFLSGADVVDNLGRRVLEKPSGRYVDTNRNGISGDTITNELGQEVKDEEIMETVYVDAQGNVFDDDNNILGKEEDILNKGYKQKKTGIGLSTLIIGADQVMSTYKAVKDTVLGTFAEIRDIQRMRQLGFRKIFSGDFKRDFFGNIIDDKKEACEAANGDCPQQRANEKKKKKGLFGRTKDKIKNTTNKIKDLPSNISTGAKDKIGKTKDKIGSTKNKIKSKLNNPHGIISNSNFKGYDKPIEIPRKPKKEKIKPKSIGDDRAKILKAREKMAEEAERRENRRKNVSSSHGVRESKEQAQRKQAMRYRRINEKKHPYPYMQERQRMKVESDRKSLLKKRQDEIQQKQREKVAQDTANLRNKRMREQGIGSLFRKGASNTRKNIRNRVSNTKDKITGSVNRDNIKNKISNSRNSLKDYFSADNKEREATGNKYGGYMKRTNKAIYDTKQLKRKAKNYIKNKKNLLQKEFAEGQLKGAIRKKFWSDKGAKLPYKLWDATKISSGFLKQDLANSTQWQSLKNQGSFLKNSITGSGAWQRMSNAKNTVTGSGAWQRMSGFATMAKTQAMGNMGAMWSMTHGGQKFSDSKYGQKLSNVKQSWKNAGGAKGAIMAGAGKVGGAVAKGGGMVLGGMSTGMGAMAGAVGKIGGLMGGILNGVMGILGPIGIIMMAVTLITGLLDAMGVDWMGPLQTAFGGFIEAMQPAIQGFGTWLSDTATKIAPALTRVGQILGPIVSALGSFISSGLDILGGVLGPIFDGIASLFEGGGGGGLFDSLSKGLEGLGPVLGEIGNLLGQGAEGFGGMIASALNGIGQYISSVILGLAQTISTFWITIGTGIKTAILTVVNGITTSISSIATTISSSILLITSSLIASVLSYGGAVRGAILMILGGIAQGIGMVGSAIQSYILGIGAVVTAVVGMVGGAVIRIVSGLGAVMAAAITMVAAAVIAGINGLATSITSGILMISTAILTTFTTFATTVATATAAAYATLLVFQGTAVGLMGTIATDMVNAFDNNFEISSIVDSEMAGAYDSLCSWGDKIVAKAGEIAARATAEYEAKSGIGSPGYIWRMTGAEWKGALGAMVRNGAYMVSAAGTIAKRIVGGYNQQYERQALFTEEELPLSEVPTPSTTPLPTTDAPVTLPQVKTPQVAKDMKNKVKDVDTPIVYNFNHYGDIDNDERADKVLKSIASRMGFENKRAGRTVNRPAPTG